MVGDVKAIAANATQRGQWSRDVADSYPDDSRFQRDAAQDSLGAKDYQDGITYAQKAVALDPNDSKALSVLARSEMHLKEYEQAIADAQHALQIDPTDKMAQSVIFFAQGKLARQGQPPVERMATVDAKPAELPPVDSGEALPRVATGLTARLPSAAPVPSDKYQKSDGLKSSAQSLFEQGDYQGAVQNASAAIDLNPQNLDAYYLRALNFIRLKMYDRALKDARDALAKAPAGTKAMWLTLQSNILNRMKRYREAEEAARQALALAPRSAEAYLNLGWAEAGLKRRSEALRNFSIAGELDPRYRSYYEEALRLPEDADLTVLFEGGARNKAAPPAQKGLPLASLVVVVASLVGGFFIALGLLRVANGDWTARLKTVFSLRRAPAVVALQGDDTPQAIGGAIQQVYPIMKKLGVGGMGVVYEAFDKKLERRVAIKKMRDEIRSDSRERERFLREAKTVAALHHPNIVGIHSIVEDGQDVYLVFEFVDGKDLHAILRERGHMGFRETLGVMREVAGALDYAHRRGVIHRDLKPSNVMIDSEGQVKVMDFGVARQAKDSLTRLSMTATVVGTPPYMAPEQEQGIVRKEADVYAMGVCLYELVTGQLPFVGAGAGMLLRKINKSYTPPSQLVRDLPAGFDAVLARALEPDPDKRFKTAGDFLKGLETLDSAGRSAPSA